MGTIGNERRRRIGQSVEGEASCECEGRLVLSAAVRTFIVLGGLFGSARACVGGGETVGYCLVAIDNITEELELGQQIGDVLVETARIWFVRGEIPYALRDVDEARRAEEVRDGEAELQRLGEVVSGIHPVRDNGLAGDIDLVHRCENCPVDRRRCRVLVVDERNAASESEVAARERTADRYGLVVVDRPRCHSDRATGKRGRVVNQSGAGVGAECQRQGGGNLEVDTLAVVGCAVLG